MLLAGTALALLAGCGVTTIDITGSYPSPLVSKLPLTMGVYYDSDFSNHSFTEINDSTGKDQYIVNSGSSQVELFNTMLPAVFQNVVELDTLDAAGQHPELDAILVPTIEEFQLGLPEKTKLNAYEVWIKYNMRLTQGNGDSIADWVMTAYGKSPQENFQSTEEGVNNATVVALRDLAANFSLEFTQIPEVNQWLKEKSVLQ